MKEKKERHITTEISADPVYGQPHTVFDLINKYGTYEIQPTCDTVNPFPAIAQGEMNLQPMGKDDVEALDPSNDGKKPQIANRPKKMNK